MIKILVVDDEKIVLDSISYILNNAYDDIRVELARNGKEAYYKYADFGPHIVITDIKMPGVDGIDLIKRIRLNDKRTKILVATAFDSFDYAKDAIKYGALDYLLKPISKANLIAAVDKAVELISRDKQKAFEDLDLLEKVNRSRELIGDHFFAMLQLGLNVEKNMGFYQEMVDFEIRNGYMLSLRSLVDMSTYESNIFIEELEKRYDFIESTHSNDKSYFLLCGSSAESAAGLKRDLEHIIFDLEKKYGEIIHIKLIKNENSQNLLMDFQLLNNHRRSLEQRVEIIDNSCGKDKGILPMVRSIRKALELFDAGEKEEFRESIKEILNLKGASRFEELLDDFHSTLKLKTMIASNDPYLTTSSKDLLSAGLKLFDKYHSAIKRIYSPIVLSAIEYIDIEYRNEISLESISEKIGVSSQYLSRIFSSEVGCTYKEYLNNKRLEDAKELLVGTDKTISDIAYEVGYNDPNYFMKLFKKSIGITPKSYKKVGKQ